MGEIRETFQKTDYHRFHFLPCSEYQLQTCSGSRVSLPRLAESHEGKKYSRTPEAAEGYTHQATLKGIGSQEKSNLNYSDTSGNYGKTTHNA